MPSPTPGFCLMAGLTQKSGAGAATASVSTIGRRGAVSVHREWKSMRPCDARGSSEVSPQGCSVGKSIHPLIARLQQPRYKAVAYSFTVFVILIINLPQMILFGERPQDIDKGPARRRGKHE